MGKCKKRNFNKYKNNEALSLKRADAVNSIIKDIKNNNYSEQTKDLITLFGITAEELSEAGATYEELMAIKYIFSFVNNH